MSSGIDAFLDHYRKRTNLLLENCLPVGGPNPQLVEAIRYATLGSGKRIRPCLVYAGASVAKYLEDGNNSNATDKVACAIELLHTYSLIHDDLPSMDDDELRRGKPTCHKAFGEATAILAGDGLQALAFEQLTLIEDLPPGIVVLLLKRLAQASGVAGMVLGQAMDLDATNNSVDISYLETMHTRKTADLIAASVVMGALSTGHASEDDLQALHSYGINIGLAFQVMDDILDELSDTETLGKQAGADIKLNKSTYTSLLGIERSKSILNDLLQQSLQVLDGFGDQAEQLRGIAHYIVDQDF